MRSRSSLLLLPFAVLALLLVGCGDDDDSADAGDTTTTAETTTEAAGGDEPDDGSPDDATDPGEDGDETTTTDEPASTEGGGEAPEDFCAAYEVLETIDETQDNTTIEGLREGADFVLDALGDVVATAPEDLQADLTLLVDASEQLKQIVDEAETPEEAEAAAGDLFEDDALNTAGDRVDEHYEASCPGAGDDEGVDAETVPEPATIPE